MKKTRITTHVFEKLVSLYSNVALRHKVYINFDTGTFSRNYYTLMKYQICIKLCKLYLQVFLMIE